VPARHASVDIESGTVRLPYSKEQIKRAPRFSIVGDLTVHQKLSILSHFTAQPETTRGRAVAEGLAA
jgi:hypothetical protein